MKIIKLFLILSAINTISCNRPECTHSNTVFDQYKPTSNEYKIELVTQMEKTGKSSVNYWIKGIEESNDTPYLVLNVQGLDLCATGHFDLRHSNKLEDVIRTKGIDHWSAKIKRFEVYFEEEANIDLVNKNLLKIVE